MDNQNQDDQQLVTERSVDEDEIETTSNIKPTEAITIHLPNVSTFTPDLKYEPNYIAVEPKKITSDENLQEQQQQQQYQLQSQHSISNKLYNFSTSSSPEYTQLVLTKENLRIHNHVPDQDDDESDANFSYKKFARQFTKHQNSSDQLQNYPQQIINLEFNEPNQQQQPQQQQNRNLVYYPFPSQSNDDSVSTSHKSQRRITKGKAFPRKHFSADTPKTRGSNTTTLTIVSQDDALKYQINNKNDPTEVQNSELAANDLNYKTRNLLIERRVAIRRTHNNSRGLLSITTPIDDQERSNNFVFAVANDTVSQQIGYNSDLEIYNRDTVFSPEYLQSANKRKNKSRTTEAYSAKTKSESNHSTITFLYKDKRFFNDDDILNYDKNNLDPHGPSPASYHVPRRPPNEKVSPSYSFGTRCLVEKKGGGRTSWEKEWFSSKNPFIIKTDFKRDKKWPTPQEYSLKPAIGHKTQLTFHQYPVYSMASKLNGSTDNLNNNTKEKHLPILNAKTHSTPTNSTNDFSEKINQFILKPKNNHRSGDFKEKESQPYYREHKPRITLKSRHDGTQLWPKKEVTPGPGAHDHTKFTSIKPSKPSFSITNSYSVGVNYTGGPYAVI